MVNLPIQLTKNFGGAPCHMQGTGGPISVVELKKQVSREVEQQCGILDNTLGLGARRLHFYSCYMTVTKLLPVSLTPSTPIHHLPAQQACLLTGKT